MKINKGDIFTVKYPFSRTMVSFLEEDGPYEFESWRPGTRGEAVYPDDCEEVADGEGEMILTVIDVFKPGKYPERVFYTRKWKDPDGKIFGKNLLKITVVSAFKRRISGYFYDYRLVEPAGSKSS